MSRQKLHLDSASQCRIVQAKSLPPLKPGEVCPQDLSVYGGKGRTSYASVEDVGNFDELIPRWQWDTLEPRIEVSTHKILAALDRAGRLDAKLGLSPP